MGVVCTSLPPFPRDRIVAAPLLAVCMCALAMPKEFVSSGKRYLTKRGVLL